MPGLAQTRERRLTRMVGLYAIVPPCRSEGPERFGRGVWVRRR